MPSAPGRDFTMRTTHPLLAAVFAASLLPNHSLAAQAPDRVPNPLPVHADVKPAPTPDPVKGYPSTDVPLAAGPTLREGGRQEPREPETMDSLSGSQVAAGPTARLDRVLYDEPGDGRIWAVGATFKASFGSEGLCYVPYFGADAPQNFPVRFELQAVRAGAADIAFAPTAMPTRVGDRIVFDRGVVREIYDLTLQGIEQTFVVNSAIAGDVVLDLRVETTLSEDENAAGLQFGNAFGRVDYGTAYLVTGSGKTAIAATHAEGVIRLVVPAAIRSGAQVVVDPLISTGGVSAGSSYAFQEPDLAYDAGADRFLVVWQVPFSSSDVDIWAEERTRSGGAVGASFSILDGTSEIWRHPSVANLQAYDKFLMVAEHEVPTNPIGQRYTVRGRTQHASTRSKSAPFLVSGPEVGDKRQPDVGGDPLNAQPTYWMVAYTRVFSSTDTDIHARRVSSDGSVASGTVFVENSAGSLFDSPQVSQSNGDLLDITAQRWVVVYTLHFSATDRDVYGAGIGWDGTLVRASKALVTSVNDETYPQISSPALVAADDPRFALSWLQVTGPWQVRAACLDNTLAVKVQATNLNSLLAIGNPSFPRIESDGCRYVAVYADGAPAYAATMGVIGNQFVVQEAATELGSGHDGFDIAITACASSGGPDTRYGIAFRDAIPTPDTIVVAAYDGHAPGGIYFHQIGCGGLGMQWTGTPRLGSTCTLQLTGVGQDLCGMLIGVPQPAVELCPGTGCRLAFRLDRPIVNFPNAITLPLVIPCDLGLVGVKFTTQGYGFGSGTCLGLLRLGHAVDITIQ